MRVLIEFEKKPLYFTHPRRLIICEKKEFLHQAFEDMEGAIKDGFYVAGFLSYEAGYAFEPALKDLFHGHFPLLCMGVYDAPQTAPDRYENLFHVSQIQNNISRADYFSDIKRIQRHIAAGDVYQITYCLKKKFLFRGDAYSFYRRLLLSQPVPYAAFIENERYKILSLSPEMFVKKEHDLIITKPMKGSWPRGKGVFNDIFGGMQLHFDRKNRAENVMIADLLRNDLGRIGSQVKAPKLFDVARYRTIFQMTSTVTAKLDPQISMERLFQAIFPSGSVTGAPKVRSMQIIRSLEKEDRKIYTGAIGYVTPGGDLFFNVPIRTILVEGQKAEMGIGGGIVWDSTAQGEWAEGEWKARFLEEAANRVGLVLFF
ncbi:MAG: chorismate-binding protein [Candidatus Omnitrophica bacterium]|nr:chorismate-binding protein [Candidatus Omnitrophota bacterium]